MTNEEVFLICRNIVNNYGNSSKSNENIFDIFETATKRLRAEIDLDLLTKVITRVSMENNDVGMFCPNCGTGVHKHIFKSDNSSVEISYCPFCGSKLDWSNDEL